MANNMQQSMLSSGVPVHLTDEYGNHLGCQDLAFAEQLPAVLPRKNSLCSLMSTQTPE